MVLGLLLVACGRFSFDGTPERDARPGEDAAVDAVDGGGDVDADPDASVEQGLVLHVTFDQSPPQDTITGLPLACESCPASVADPRGMVGQFVRTERSCAHIPDDARLHASTFTLMLWMRPNAPAGANMTAYSRPIPGATSTGNTREIYIISSNVLRTIVQNVALLGDTPTGWQNVALVYDGTTALLYVDGDLVRMMAGGGPVFEPTDEHIGCDVNQDIEGQYFDGLLDDVRLYDYALSQDQIRAVAGLLTQ